MSKRALEIAKEHLEKANPSLWDGQGNPPADFDSRIGTYPINNLVEVDLSFEFDESGNELGWIPLCELRDAPTGDLMGIASCGRINSVEDIADLVDEVLSGNKSKKERKNPDVRAMEIAAEHLQKKNPSMWDGQGEAPTDFDSSAATYPIDDETELDISFEYDQEDGWLHLCELRNCTTKERVDSMHGYGVDSPQNLADTVWDICSALLY